MPNYVDSGDHRHAPRQRSSQGGAVRRTRKANPVYCEHDYQAEDPTVPDEEALCSARAIRHSDPPRCAAHGGVHAAEGRKRTEGGYVKVNERMRKVISGEIALSELDEEELARGQLRGANGKFSGNAPLVVPRAMHAKMTTELFKRADDAMKSSLVNAVQTLTTIMESDLSDPKDKLKAAQWLIERVMGKTPEQLIVGQQQPWEQLLVKITSDKKEHYEAFVQRAGSEDPRW